MRQLKQLYDAVGAHHGDEVPEALHEAMQEAEEFLLVSKSFEYDGLLKLRGAVVELKDIGADFDDMLKVIAGKTVSSDISLHVKLYLVVTEPSEAKEDAKAA